MPSTLSPAHPAATTTDEERFLCYGRTGDPAVLDALLAVHLDRGWAVACRITGDPDVAADAVQEACLRLLRTAWRYDGQVPFGAWWTRLVVAAASNRRRAERRLRRREAHAAGTAPAIAPTAPAQPAEAVQEAVAALPAAYREAVQLVYFLGCTQEEAAAALAVPPGTIASRLHRARLRLRRQLAHDETALALATGCWRASSPAPTVPPGVARAVRALVAARRGVRPWGMLRMRWLRQGLSWAASLLAAAGAAVLLDGFQVPIAGGTTGTVAGTPGTGAAEPAAHWFGASPFTAEADILQVAVTRDATLLLATGSGLEAWDLQARTRRWRILPGILSDTVFVRPQGDLVILETPYHAPCAVDLIDVRSGRITWRAPLPATLAGEFTLAALSPDGQVLVAAKFDERDTLHVIDLASRRVRADLHPLPAASKGRSVAGLAFAPDGTHLAVLASQRDLILWDWPAWAHPQVLTGTLPLAEELHWREPTIIEAREDRSDGWLPPRPLQVLLPTGARQLEPGGRALSLTPRHVRWAEDTLTADADTPRARRLWIGPMVGALHDDAQVSPDGAWMCASTQERTPVVVDLRHDAVVVPADTGLLDPVATLAVLEDGSLLTGDGHRLQRWDAQGRSLGVIQRDHGDWMGIWGRCLCVADPNQGVLRLLDVVTGAGVATMAMPVATAVPHHIGIQASMSEAQLSPDRAWLVTGGSDGVVQAQDLVHGRTTARWPTYRCSSTATDWSYRPELGTCAFLPGGQCLLSTLAMVDDPSPTGAQHLPLCGIYDLASGTQTVGLTFADGAAVEAGAFTLAHHHPWIAGTAIRRLNHRFRRFDYELGRDYVLEAGIWEATSGQWLRALPPTPQALGWSEDDAVLLGATGAIDATTGAILRQVPEAVTARLSPLQDLVLELTRLPDGTAHAAVRDARWGTVLATTALGIPAPPPPAPPTPPAPGDTGGFVVVGPMPDSTCTAPDFLQWRVEWDPAETRVALVAREHPGVALVSAFPTRGDGTAMPPLQAIAALSAADTPTALASMAALGAADRAVVPALEATVAAVPASLDGRCRAATVLAWRAGVGRQEPASRAALAALAAAADPTTRALATAALARVAAADAEAQASAAFAATAASATWPPRLQEF